MKPEKKKIILGVTGGIAAYKSADLCSKLTGAGFDVHVIMTASAQQLITQRCFLTLSRNPVICSLWDVPDWKPEHIELSESADLCVVAPCTANFIGKHPRDRGRRTDHDRAGVHRHDAAGARHELPDVEVARGAGQLRDPPETRRAVHRTGKGTAGLRRRRCRPDV